MRRCERAEAGELLHLDVKKLGRITRIGRRINGDRRGQVDHAGWEYVPIAVDDASRVGYAQVLPDEQGDSAGAFLRAAVADYAALGLVLREVLTDNGACFRSRYYLLRFTGQRRMFSKRLSGHHSDQQTDPKERPDEEHHL